MGQFDNMLKRGIAVTAVEKGRTMACGGVSFVDEKEGMVWVKMSKDCSQRPFMWARTVKEAFNLMVTSVGNVRISTYILDKFCKGEKLAKLINLKRTNEKEKYNGNIYNKYSMVI
ncbi:hypothetical protein LCGC14_0375630 [marine sediment metagenome]|uniref:Uncharacterized protein n=1 Tax=marine sediment metagenome TaxID=412755 RepID=A0A0F9T3N0_9ZZZZ